MGSLPREASIPWSRTPTIYSPELSRLSGCNIYLKLENLQPSGSFKSRGVGNLMVRALAASPSPETVHFYCSSGGNAGLACATAALSLKRPATIVLPASSPPLMKKKLLALGVDVIIHGKNWAEADGYLRRELLTKEGETGVYVPPFDHQHLWDGAATIVDELRDQIDGPIHGIVGSVGGGGMINGIMQGVMTLPWNNQPPQVIAVETVGADSLNASVRAGSHVRLPAITSIATSLGAPQVSAKTWEYASNYPETMQSVVVSDADAAISCVRFADDARFLVEVSCGAALAPMYRGDLRERVGKGCSDEEWRSKNVVMIVCGGAAVALETLASYREKYGSETSIKTC